MALLLETNKMRCATRKCGTVVPVEAATVATSHDGHWQFLCPRCNFWNLASSSNSVEATAPTPFDLERLPSSVRYASQVKRSPPGGI